MMTKRVVFALAVVALAVTFAQAQSPSRPGPLERITMNASGAIAVTDTFQSVFVAGSRANCFVQNNSASGKMYVFFGPIANATKEKSIALAAGAVWQCSNAGVVSIDQVSITGTALDKFTAWLQ